MVRLRAFANTSRAVGSFRLSLLVAAAYVLSGLVLMTARRQPIAGASG
jgi:hypothetical protein